MRRRRLIVLLLAAFALLVAVAVVPFVHPMEFRNGDILIHGFFALKDNPEGFHYSEQRMPSDNLVMRVYFLRLGPFAWEVAIATHN